MRPTASVLLLASLLMPQSATSAESPDQKGYTYPLFDGASLHGWTVENNCEVEVRDGMLLLKGGDGWLRSDHEYGDFRLHVEWKALQAENYDAGIYIRTRAGGEPFPKDSYQVNLLQGKEGNIGKLPGAESTGLARPAGEWNTFDLTVSGETVALAINGKPAYEAGGLTIPAGYVGFQVEVPKGGQFLIRNVRLTELGHHPLFNGTDLAGWVGAGQPAENCWTVQDEAIVCTGEKGPWLRSDEQYGDFNLRLEYQVASGGNSGVYIRVPENGNHHRDNEEQPPAGIEIQVLDDSHPKHATLKDYQYSASVYDIAGARQRVSKQPGEWNTLEIECRGSDVKTIHNGVVVVDATLEEFPLLALRLREGYLGLQNHQTVVKFRRLRIGAPLEKLK